MKQTAEKIYNEIGEGYGYNGSKEDALKLINSFIEPLLSRAFVAGRSKTSYKDFLQDLAIVTPNELASYKAELRADIDKLRAQALETRPPSEFWKGKFIALNQVLALLEDNPTEK